MERKDVEEQIENEKQTAKKLDEEEERYYYNLNSHHCLI